ncbi:hypothetical protein PQR72_20570 [Paraburkholderia madseniana]|uniref:hypothetical protein n=1 Tax=Paraburkholderia madseniana TaxID=2599607 RepID=UPI0015C54D4B|nr:hypothetical protein [Paraburkholderia madseniana]NPT66391.1 hypothetical protein [Paraburkholderia madseniana]
MKKKLISCFLLVGLLSCAAASAAPACRSNPIISGFVSDVFYQSPETLVTGFKGTPINTIATTLAWSVVEPKRGRVDLSMYYAQLDALTRDGYCLILLVDTSGRVMRSEVARMLVKDVNTLPLTTLPDWVGSLNSAPRSVDFFGAPAGPLDFEDRLSRSAVEDLYRVVLPRLKARYGDSIYAIAPCVTTECEVKYSQTGFAWQSYSHHSQAAFRERLARKGITPADMPTMNYPNQLAGGAPRVQPLYPEMQSFREDSLRDYVCSLTSIIRRTSLKSIGYFGQTFAFPDGIYATGVIEKTRDCFDVAAIDYNFYNGYGVELKSEIPAFLTDYALSLGYRQVLVGLYMERFRDPKTSVVDPTAYKVLRESFARIRPDARIVGTEIGNLTQDEFRNVIGIDSQVRAITQPKPATNKAKRVAIYASMANSYLWEGEWSNGRQIMQDNLLATYSYLRSMPGITVDIVTDESIRKSGLSGYALVVLPHVSAMPDSARKAIVKYEVAGGKVMADMRPDEYRPDGSIQSDMALRNALGIGAAQAVSGDINLTGNLVIERQTQYVNGFLMAPLKGYRIAYPSRSGNGEGLILRGENTVVFGFLPLLVEGKQRLWARDQFKSEVLRLITGASTR